MKEIAIYGKGGIGKSTIAANLSAALADSGLRVLQIGCDPKHDSTRLLLQGKELMTVLDYLKVTGPMDYKIEDVLAYGYKNIGCVEAGGPEPGVGCAGRGIITTFELLDQFQIKDNYDITVYDVLGDVVCGGFAVPIRQEYADIIFIVTSGEYMALYAANNILRGVKNYDGSKPRVAGILYNKRNIEDEDNRIEKFAEAVDLPIFATIPRSDVFAQADRDNVSVVESGLDFQIGNVFASIANNINDEISLYEAKPVTDNELEQIIFGKAKTIKSEHKKEVKEEKIINDTVKNNRYLSKNMVYNEPLHGCAFNGAISMAIHLQDAIVIAHSLKSCTYISYQSISSPGRRALFERGALLPVSITPNFESTNMNESDVIFGGLDTLKEKIINVKKRKPKAIIIVSSCPAGIIGDDIDKVKNLAETDMPIYTIKADGNLTGDYLQGMLMSYTSLAQNIIKKDVSIVPNTVNVVFEKVVAKNTNSNFKLIESYLNYLGISVNCRFLCETTLEKLENFLSAPLNLLAFQDYTGQILKDFFIDNYNCQFLDKAFPVGFMQTKEWLYEVASFFKKEDIVNDLIKKEEEKYWYEVNLLKPSLKGKRLMIVTYNHEIDWILKTALDLEINIVKVGILNFSQDVGFRTNLDLTLNVEENYDAQKRFEDINKYNPDILLTNYSTNDYNNVSVNDTIPMCPDVGFNAGLNMAKRWSKLFNLKVQGEWKNDEQLFRKYYTR